jgi:hypothetical protein
MFHEAFETLEVLAVEFVRRAKIDGDTMLHNAILLKDCVEDFKGPPTIDHEIF